MWCGPSPFYLQVACKNTALKFRLWTIAQLRKGKLTLGWQQGDTDNLRDDFLWNSSS